MKKSKFHYASDILMFGVATPGFSLLLFKEAINQEWIVLENTILLDFIQDFSLIKLNNTFIICTLCFLFFGSIFYCLNIGYNRQLITDKNYKIFSEIILTIGLATTLILLSILVLSELQLSIFTGWLSLVALIVSLSKLSLNSNMDHMEDNRNNEQSTQDTIEK